MLSHAALRAQLHDRLDVLTRRVGAIERDLRRAPDRDSQERATELENDEVLEALDESNRAEVLQIRAALRRLDAGTYGLCAACGRAIAPARLAALPSATHCVACADASRV